MLLKVTTYSFLYYIFENIVLQMLVDEFLYYYQLSFRHATKILRKLQVLGTLEKVPKEVNIQNG